MELLTGKPLLRLLRAVGLYHHADLPLPESTHICLWQLAGQRHGRMLERKSFFSEDCWKEPQSTGILAGEKWKKKKQRLHIPHHINIGTVETQAKFVHIPFILYLILFASSINLIIKCEGIFTKSNTEKNKFSKGNSLNILISHDVINENCLKCCTQ